MLLSMSQVGFFTLGSVWLVTFNGIPLSHSALLLHLLFHVFMLKYLEKLCNNHAYHIVYCMYMEKTILRWKTCVWSFCHYLDNRICLNLNVHVWHSPNNELPIYTTLEDFGCVHAFGTHMWAVPVNTPWQARAFFYVPPPTLVGRHIVFVLSICPSHSLSAQLLWNYWTEFHETW